MFLNPWLQSQASLFNKKNRSLVDFMDYGKILSEGFQGWWKKPKAIQYGVYIFLASLFFSFILMGIGALLFGSLEKYVQFSFGADNETDPLADFSAILAFLAVAMIFGVALFVILRILEGKIFAEALQAKRLAQPFSTEKGLRFAVLSIASSLVALFCWYNKKWLLLLLGCLIGIVILVFGIVSTNWIAILVGALLAVLLGIAYLAIVIYNSVRLAFADIVFVEKNHSIGSALQESWKISDKKALRVFIAFFLVGIACFILAFLVGLAPGILGLAAAFSKELQLPAFLLHLAVSAVMNGLLLLITAFAAVETYEQVLREPIIEK